MHPTDWPRRVCRIRREKHKSRPTLYTVKVKRLALSKISLALWSQGIVHSWHAKDISACANLMILPVPL